MLSGGRNSVWPVKQGVIAMGAECLKDCARYLDDPNKPDEVSNEMTMEVARFYYENDYDGPKFPKFPGVDFITYAWLPKVTFKVSLVGGEVVAVSYVNLKSEFLIVGAKMTSTHAINRFYYAFSCASEGRPTFTKRFFSRDAADSRHPV